MVRVDRPYGRPPVGRALARDIGPSDDSTPELDRVACRSPCRRSRCARLPRAWSATRRGSRTRRASTPPRAPGPRRSLGHGCRCRCAGRRSTTRRAGDRRERDAEGTRRMPTSERPATRRRVASPRGPRLRAHAALGRPGRTWRARGPRWGSRPGPAARAWAASACRHLTRAGMPPAEIPSISGTSPNCARSRRYAWCAAVYAAAMLFVVDQRVAELSHHVIRLERRHGGRRTGVREVVERREGRAVREPGQGGRDGGIAAHAPCRDAHDSASGTSQLAAEDGQIGVADRREGRRGHPERLPSVAGTGLDQPAAGDSAGDSAG